MRKGFAVLLVLIALVIPFGISSTANARVTCPFVLEPPYAGAIGGAVVCSVQLTQDNVGILLEAIPALAGYTADGCIPQGVTTEEDGSVWAVENCGGELVFTRMN